MSVPFEKRVLLVDLPVFPDKILSLSLPIVAGYFAQHFETVILDLNFKEDLQEFENSFQEFDIVGFKVSCQNVDEAKILSRQIKECNAKVIIIWGGEFPSLLSGVAKEFCDIAVSGQFDPVADKIINDLKKGSYTNLYTGHSAYSLDDTPKPRFDLLKGTGRYSAIMGFPFETSKGCSQKCNFCMVHTMQRNQIFKSPIRMFEELQFYNSCFLNVIDYNLGADKNHLLNVANTIEKSKISGWMGEMCIESLDDDEVLLALEKSRCKIIYCGLESVSTNALKSINKSQTNHPDNYARIIKKAQKHNINIASGLILGLPNTSEEDYEKTIGFFTDMNLIYTKFTTLTYNPGTAVHQSMKKHGTYRTEEYSKFDGRYFTFVPNGCTYESLVKIKRKVIEMFYSENSIKKRAAAVAKTNEQFNFFKNFNNNYAEVYLSSENFITL